MKITKKHQEKLAVFVDYLTRYLNDWKNKEGFFFYDSVAQRTLASQIAENTLKDAQEFFDSCDQDEQSSINDMINAKEISFKANLQSPLHYFKF